MLFRDLAVATRSLRRSPVLTLAAALTIALGIGADETNVHSLAAGDPTIVADVGFRYEIYAMPRAVTRPA